MTTEPTMAALSLKHVVQGFRVEPMRGGLGIPGQATLDGLAAPVSAVG